MVSFSYVVMTDRLKKDMKSVNECKDIRTILSSLTHGVALTVNFPEVVKEAEKNLKLRSLPSN